jgi:hypothetical protein
MVIGARASLCTAGAEAASARALSSMVNAIVDAAVVVRKLRRLKPRVAASGERFVVLMRITSSALMRHIHVARLHPRQVGALRPSSWRSNEI